MRHNVNAQNQNEMWSKHTFGVTLQDAISTYNNPAIFQKELKTLIDKYAQHGKKIIEVGCELGANSFILDKRYSKTLLDINSQAINLANLAFEYFNEERDTALAVADMIEAIEQDRMPYVDGQAGAGAGVGSI